MIALPQPCLCLITNRRLLAPDARTTQQEIAALEAWLDQAIDARLDLIQIRERDLDAAVLRRLTVRVSARAATTPTHILVNDRVDVAIAAGADGAHLRGDGPAQADVRRLGPAGWIVGRSIHSAEEAARHADADYLLFGTVFETASKSGVAPAGLTALRAAIEATTAPVLAVGGVTAERARGCAAAGAHGVAAIGVFLPPGRAPGSLGPGPAAAALRAALAGERC